MKRRFMRKITFLACLIVIFARIAQVPHGGDAHGAPGVSDGLPLSGDALQRKLTETVGVSWSGVALGDVVASIERNTRVCIWLDRRVDRNLRVEWSSAGRSLRETLEQLAAAYGLDSGWVGSVCYVGPKGAATGLASLIARRNSEITTLPANLRVPLTDRAPLRWEDLTEPRSVLAQLTAQAGWSLQNADAMPHDLWSRQETPPLTWNERLSLLTVGFELTYQFQPATKEILLSPWPQELVVAKVGATRKPIASANGTGKAIAPPSPAAPGRQVYSLRVQDVPLSKLIEVLQQKHGLKIRVDAQAVAAAGLTLDKQTAVDVQNATLEALLQQAASPLGLHARRDGDTVVIEPKK